jgi:hypothetical protein
LASRVGVLPASGGYVGVFAGTYAAAGRVPGRRGDVVAAVADGVMLAAVLNHYASWPRDPQRSVPWLIECEGPQGPLLVPYNVMLMLSAVLSMAGLAEARGASWWGFGAASAVPAPALGDSQGVRTEGGAGRAQAALVEPAPRRLRERRRH